MSKKKYDWDAKKYKGCNKTRGLLLTEEQISSIRYYLFLAGLKCKFDALRRLKLGIPQHLVMHEWHKYKEVTSLCADLNELMPHVYVRV